MIDWDRDLSPFEGGAVRIHRDPTMIDLLGSDATSLEPESLRHSPNSVVLLSPSGRVLTASHSAIAVLGLDDLTQLLGRHWCKIWPTWVHDALSEAVDRALAGKITTYWANYPSAEGVLMDWDIRVSPVFDDADCVSSVLAVSRPVTKH